MQPRPMRHGRMLFTGLLEAMTQVMASAKGYLFHHGPQVAMLAQDLAQDFGLDRRARAEIFFASLLADLGMVGLVEGAWEEPVPELPPLDRSEVERHPQRSAEMVDALPYLSRVATLVHDHHEWWDGSGYPRGLEGDRIPLGAQIIRLADTVCALMEERPHRPALNRGQVRMIVAAGIGSEFGPEVGRRFLRMVDRRGLPEFRRELFERHRHQAVQDLLPENVSMPSVEGMLEVLGALIDAKDPYTGGHSRRVALLAGHTARALGMDERVQSDCRAAGHLHDLGKLSVPLKILWKPSGLNGGEAQRVRAHTSSGAMILETIPALRHLSSAARYHHERWDGKGYPEGISGERIPFIPRVLAVCDSYDAMTSGRAYHAPRSHLEAMGEVERGLGTLYDPRVGQAFLDLPDRVFREVRNGTPTHRADVFRSPLSRPRGGRRSSGAVGD